MSRTRRSRVNSTIAVLMAASLGCFRLATRAVGRVGPPRAPVTGTRAQGGVWVCGQDAIAWRRAPHRAGSARTWVSW